MTMMTMWFRFWIPLAGSICAVSSSGCMCGGGFASGLVSTPFGASFGSGGKTSFGHSCTAGFGEVVSEGRVEPDPGAEVVGAASVPAVVHAAVATPRNAMASTKRATVRRGAGMRRANANRCLR